MSEKSENKRKPLWRTLLRVAISFGLLAVVYGTTDLKSLLQTLASVSALCALSIIALYTIGQVVSTVKWRLFVRSIGLDRTFSESVRAYFFGMYVNTFAFGTVGGDVARCLALQPPKGKRAAAVATAVADRVHGLAILLLIGAVSIIIVQPEILGWYAVPLSIFVVVALGVGWIYGPRLLTLLFPEGHRFGEAAREVANAFPRDVRMFATATLISAFFHCIQIFMHFIIARELGADLSLAYLFATVPLVNVASSAPISINGLGVREGMYLLLFVPAGVTQETAVAMGAIWIVSVTIVSALGGALLAPEIKREVVKKVDEGTAKSTVEQKREVASG